MSACAQVRDVCNDCIHILMEKENLVLGNIINPTRDVFHLNPVRVKLTLASSEQRLDEARWNAVTREDNLAQIETCCGNLEESREMAHLVEAVTPLAEDLT